MDFKKFLEELQNINPKTPGSWPLAIKLASFASLFVVVVAAGAFFDWQDQ